MKGVLRFLSKFMDSIVCGSSPWVMSTTRIAISQSEEPRDLRLLNDSWPGVSMMSSPGNFRLLMSNCKNKYHIIDAFLPPREKDILS